MRMYGEDSRKKEGFTKGIYGTFGQMSAWYHQWYHEQLKLNVFEMIFKLYTMD